MPGPKEIEKLTQAAQAAAKKAAETKLATEQQAAGEMGKVVEETSLAPKESGELSVENPVIVRKKRPELKEKRDSVIAQTFSDVELSDAGAAVLNDFVDFQPPNEQNDVKLGLLLADKVVEAFEGKAIGATEALIIEAHLAAFYGKETTTQQEFQRRIERIVNQAPVINKEQIAHEDWKEVVGAMGESTVEHEQLLKQGAEIVVEELNKSYGREGDPDAPDLLTTYDAAREKATDHKSAEVVYEATADAGKVEDIDKNSLETATDLLQKTVQGLEKETATYQRAVTQEEPNVEQIEEATGALYQVVSHSPEGQKAVNVFEDVMLETVVVLVPATRGAVSDLQEAINQRDAVSIQESLSELQSLTTGVEVTNVAMVHVHAAAIKAIDESVAVSVDNLVMKSHTTAGVQMEDVLSLDRALENADIDPQITIGFYGVLLKKQLPEISSQVDILFSELSKTDPNAEIVKEQFAALNQRIKGKGNIRLWQGIQDASLDIVDWQAEQIEAAPVKVNFYDAANPGTATSTKVKEGLESIQFALDNYPEYLDDYMFLNSMRRELEKTMKYPSQEVLPYIEKLRFLEEKARPVYEKFQQIAREQEQPFSEFYLSPAENRGLKKDPLWLIDRFLQRVEENAILFPDTPAAQAATRRLQVMSSYITSDQFVQDARRYANSPESGFKTKAEQQEYISRMERVSKEASEKIHYRNGAQNAYGYFRGTGDPDKLGDALLAFGVKGKEFLLREYGGLVQDAYDRFNAALNQVVYDPKTGERRRLEGRVIAEARAIAEKEFIRDKNLYARKMKRAFVDRTDEKGKPIKDITDNDIRAALRLGEYVSVLTQQEAIAMNRGLGPGESNRFSNINSFATANTTEMVLMAWDPKRWFFDKWHNLDPGKRVIWENIAYFAAKSKDRLGKIQKRIRSVKKGSSEWNELVIEAFGFKMEGDRKVANEEEIKHFFEREEKRKVLGDMGARGIDRVLQPHAKDSQLLTSSDLERGLMVKEGAEIAGRLIHMYDYFSSGWRGGTYVSQIEEIWSYGKNMALGLRLKGVGDVLYKAETDKDRDVAIRNLLPVLKQVADYRPHALLQFLHDGKEKVVSDWFSAQALLFKPGHGIAAGKNVNISGKTLGERIDRPDQLYNYVMRRFLTINSLLAEKGLAYIDYSAGPTGGQRRVVERVCRSMGTDADKYLELMQDMSQHMGQQPNLEKLTENKYYGLYERTQWVDDLRLSYLEDPNNASGAKKLKKGQKERYPISQVLIDKGQGKGDPLVRVWKDTKKGVDAVLALYAALTPKKDTYFKSLAAMYPSMKEFSGSKPIAARAMINILAGMGMTLKTDDIFNLFMVGDLPRGSQAKRLFSSLADSLDPNELHHWLEQHGMELETDLRLLAPGSYREAMKYISMEAGVGEFSVRVPLYADRVRLVILAGLLLIASETAKDSAQVLQSEGK